jgi:hypothetical protein
MFIFVFLIDTDIKIMIRYHGTDQASAQQIITHIDVTRGGGELGRGFYVGENISLAAARAKGKHNNNFAVVQFDINKAAYIKLDIKILKTRQFVVRQWKSFFDRKITKSYLYDCDVVCAPYATFEFSYQYKFESTAGEVVINSAVKTIIQ